MTGILIAVVVLVGVIACADLLISFALIRRVAALQARGPQLSGPAIGREVGQFRVPLLGGGEFSRDHLAAPRTLAVFLTTSCEPCRRAITELSAMPGPLPWPLYVILIRTDADDDDAVEVAGQMPAGSRVGIIAAAEAPLEAFGIDGYPTVLTIEDGIIRASGFRVAALLEGVSR
ncbi:MAG: hypothetical protein ACRDPY_26190 [Streptosporangiaceae bacterium]